MTKPLDPSEKSLRKRLRYPQWSKKQIAMLKRKKSKPFEMKKIPIFHPLDVN